MFTFSNPGQFFGPAEALALYRSLPVSTPDGTVTVSITSYRNANHTDAASGCVASLELKEALRQADGAAVARAGGAQNFVDVFTGKGSPGGIVSVLESFVYRAVTFQKKWLSSGPRTTAGQCAALLGDETISWQETVQRICDTWIGLDCSGFVGNWLQLTEPSFKIGPNTPIRYYTENRKVTYRTSVDEIQYWDVMVYCQNEHIAAVNSTYLERPGVLDVCQSAGGGPRENDYRFLPRGNKQFQLSPTTKDDIGYNFYVINLWPEA